MEETEDDVQLREDGRNSEDGNDSALYSSTSYGPEEKIYENLQHVEEPASVTLHDELRILLLGARGSGKSSTGNSILRSSVFKSDMQLSRLTQVCERACGQVLCRPVAIIDTPGLNRAKRTEKEVTKEILRSLSLCSPGPHVFLLVMPVGNLSNDDRSMHKLMESMFGKSIWRYTIIVFTHGDRLEGKTANDVITNSDKDLRNFIHKCSGGFVFFNNKESGSLEPVTELLKKVETLVAVNGKSCYSTRFFPASERKIRKKVEKILETRKNSIAQKERELEMWCSTTQELERKKQELWRQEEDQARKEAEVSSKRSMSVKLKPPKPFAIKR